MRQCSKCGELVADNAPCPNIHQKSDKRDTSIPITDEEIEKIRAEWPRLGPGVEAMIARIRADAEKLKSVEKLLTWIDDYRPVGSVSAAHCREMLAKIRSPRDEG